MPTAFSADSQTQKPLARCMNAIESSAVGTSRPDHDSGRSDRRFESHPLRLELPERAEDRTGKVSLGTMHLAKGLELKMLIVMACAANVLPSSSRIDAAGDEPERVTIQTVRHAHDHARLRLPASSRWRP